MKVAAFRLFPAIFIAGTAMTLSSQAKINNNINGLTEDIAHFKVDVGHLFGYFAKNRASVEFEFATKNVYDINGKPQTSMQKEELDRMEDYFKHNVAEMFGFQNLNCTYKLDDISKKYRKKMHSNIGVIEIRYKVICDQELNGKEIVLNLSSLKDIKAIRYTIDAKKVNRGYILGDQGTILVPR